MASISPSPFTLREFIQLVLPAIIAVCLFSPLLFPLQQITVERMIFAGIIVGYLISGLMTWIAHKTRPILPGFAKRRASSNVVETKWNLDQLEASLTNDELETLDVINSNAIFSQMIGIYLCAYLVYGLFHFGKEIITRMTTADPTVGGQSLYALIGQVRTKMIFGADLPTWIVLLITASLIVFALKDFLDGYESLFSQGGKYDQLAAKYHADGKGVARIWGRVLINGKPGAGVDVSLLNTSDSEVEGTKSDQEGYYKFDRAMDKSGSWKVKLVLHKKLKGASAEPKTVGDQEQTVVLSLPTSGAATFDLNSEQNLEGHA